VRKKITNSTAINQEGTTKDRAHQMPLNSNTKVNGLNASHTGMSLLTLFPQPKMLFPIAWQTTLFFKIIQVK
jgi:hypothetical protein